MTSDKIRPAYTVRTQRLVLRCWEPKDAPLLLDAVTVSVDHLRPWMPWAKDEPKPLADKIALIRRWRGEFDLNQDFVYGIFNQDESFALGGSGLHTRLGEGVLEIGYWIRVDHINQGFATELSAALTKMAFEIHQVKRVEIHIDSLNQRSAAIPRKLNFLHEATLRQRLRSPEDEPRDVMIWTLLADEYAGSLSQMAEVEAFDVVGEKLL